MARREYGNAPTDLTLSDKAQKFFDGEETLHIYEYDITTFDNDSGEFVPAHDYSYVYAGDKESVALSAYGINKELERMADEANGITPASVLYSDALTHSANELRAMGYTMPIAFMFMPLDEATVEDFVGSSDPRDWLDKTGEEMTQRVEDLLVEWYDKEHKERPSYSAQDMGVSLVLLALEYLE